MHGPRQDPILRDLCADLGFVTREARAAGFNYPSLTPEKGVYVPFMVSHGSYKVECSLYFLYISI
jgi:hypothetical protein